MNNTSNRRYTSSRISSEEEEEMEQTKKRKNYFPKKKKNIKKEHKEEDEEDKEQGTLHCRCSPKNLVKALQNLTVEQIVAIEKMGLGNILHLKVKEIPTRLAYIRGGSMDYTGLAQGENNN